MYPLLLRPVQHYLIYRLSEEALSEAANGVLGVGLVEDLDEVLGFEDLQEVDDLLVGLVAEGRDVLENARAEDVTHNCCTL